MFRFMLTIVSGLKSCDVRRSSVYQNITLDLTLSGVPVAVGDVANSFAKHFSKKIKLNVSKIIVNLNFVYNGKCKLLVQNRNFMQKSDVKKCLYDLSNKKCVCLINDSKDIVLDPMSPLFSNIYRQSPVKTPAIKPQSR